MRNPYFSRAFLDACDEKDLAILRRELGHHPGDRAHLAEVEAEIERRTKATSKAGGGMETLQPIGVDRGEPAPATSEEDPR